MNAERMSQRYAPRLPVIGSLYFTSLWVRTAHPATLAIDIALEAGSFLTTSAGESFALPQALFGEARDDFIPGRRLAAVSEELQSSLSTNCNGSSEVIAIGSNKRNCLPRRLF
jgi:hypothetical protein